MADLTKRLVVRISDDLHAWIGQQAEQEGLDSATWVRSTLTKMMRGKSSFRETFEGQTLDGQAIRAEVLTGPMPPSAEEADPIDIDALVDEGLSQVIGQAEMQEAQEQAHSNGVRAVMRRPPPFSLATQPRWIDQK